MQNTEILNRYADTNALIKLRNKNHMSARINLIRGVMNGMGTALSGAVTAVGVSEGHGINLIGTMTASLACLTDIRMQKYGISKKITKQLDYQIYKKTGDISQCHYKRATLKYTKEQDRIAVSNQGKDPNIIELQSARNNYSEMAKSDFRSTIRTYALTAMFLGLGAYNLEKSKDKSDVLLATTFATIWAANGVTASRSYKRNKWLACEKDCDIFEENGGDIQDCKFPRYVRSQFTMDNQPA